MRAHIVLGSHAQRRIVVRGERVRGRWRWLRQRGQTLIIFALPVTVLVGLAGLTVDVARLYDLYARMQRAAVALRERVGVSPGKRTRVNLERAAAKAQSFLGEMAWAVAFAAGRALALEEAIPEAP